MRNVFSTILRLPSCMAHSITHYLQHIVTKYVKFCSFPMSYFIAQNAVWSAVVVDATPLIYGALKLAHWHQIRQNTIKNPDNPSLRQPRAKMWVYDAYGRRLTLRLVLWQSRQNVRGLLTSRNLSCTTALLPSWRSDSRHSSTSTGWRTSVARPSSSTGSSTPAPRRISFAIRSSTRECGRQWQRIRRRVSSERRPRASDACWLPPTIARGLSYPTWRFWYMKTCRETTWRSRAASISRISLSLCPSDRRTSTGSTLPFCKCRNWAKYTDFAWNGGIVRSDCRRRPFKHWVWRSEATIN